MVVSRGGFPMCPLHDRCCIYKMYLIVLTPCELGTQSYFTEKETSSERQITYPGFELKSVSLHTMLFLLHHITKTHKTSEIFHDNNYFLRFQLIAVFIQD